jgi:hypothetical protein
LIQIAIQTLASELYQLVFQKITSLAKVVTYENQSGQSIETKEFGFVSNIEDAAPNALTQAYEHVKKLPEFAGATDC